MRIPLGIHVGDRMTLPETWEVAKYTDEKGFDSFWVAEGRMARDGIVPAAVVAKETKRLKDRHRCCQQQEPKRGTHGCHL